MGANSDRPAGHLLRILGLVFGVAAVVGGMVGQGILRAPGIVAGAVHSSQMVLLLWLAGALIAAISALAYVELGAAIPCAGGPYDYVRRAFGEVPGALTGWAAWLITITGLAIFSTVIGEFAHRLETFGEINPTGIALGVLGIFWAVNWTGTRICGASQILFSACKGGVLIGLIILLFAQPAQASPQTQTITGTLGLASIGAAMIVITSTYNGWYDVVYYCEEFERPEKVLPRAMFGGIVSVAALFLLMNIALLHVLTPAAMAESNLPAAEAASVALGARGAYAVALFGIFSVATITNYRMMSSARIAYALARDRILPAALATIAPGGTPRVALTVNVLVAAAFVITGSYLSIVATSSALVVFVVLLTNCASIRLRSRLPEMRRPFRIPVYPLPPLLAIVANLALLVAFTFKDPAHCLLGFAILLGIGVFYALLARARPPRTRSFYEPELRHGQP